MIDIAEMMSEITKGVKNATLFKDRSVSHHFSNRVLVERSLDKLIASATGRAVASHRIE